MAAAQPESAQPADFLSLDDLTVVVVLRHLPLAELVSMRLTCRRLAALVSHDDMLWAQRVQHTFGISLQGASDLLPVFKALHHGGQRCVLPFQAVLTDQGCDVPWTSYWAGNLFQMTPRRIFCSTAGTRNVHVLGVLAGLPNSTQPPPTSAQPGLATARVSGSTAGPSTPSGPTRSEDSDAGHRAAATRHREQLLAVCAHCAAYLLPPVALVSLRLPATLPPISEACLAAARTRLAACSTLGLEDLFMWAYGSMARGEAWGRALLRGIGSVGRDADIQAVHSLARRVWHVTTVPAAPPLDLAALDPHSRVIVDRTALTQLTRLAQASPEPTDAASSVIHLGVFDELQINRHSNVTCPVRSGVVYACVATPAARPTGGAGQATGPCPSSGDGLGWRNDAQAVLASVAGNPWVAALSDATNAAAVLTAAARGALPPAQGWYATQLGEWVEFARDDSGGPAWRGAPDTYIQAQLHPVVWFRFYDASERAVEQQRQVRHVATQGPEVQAGLPGPGGLGPLAAAYPDPGPAGPSSSAAPTSPSDTLPPSLQRLLEWAQANAPPATGDANRSSSAPTADKLAMDMIRAHVVAAARASEVVGRRASTSGSGGGASRVPSSPDMDAVLRSVPPHQLRALNATLSELWSIAAAHCRELQLWVGLPQTSHDAAAAASATEDAPSSDGCAQRQQAVLSRLADRADLAMRSAAGLEPAEGAERGAGLSAVPSARPPSPAWDWANITARIRDAGGAGDVPGEGRLPADVRPTVLRPGSWETAPRPSFPVSPGLGSTRGAPEVAAVMGWGNGGGVPEPHVLTIRLHLSWAVNGLCVKLCDAEDAAPHYNSGRGGTNVDACWVAALGRHVALPLGCRFRRA